VGRGRSLSLEPPEPQRFAIVATRRAPVAGTIPAALGVAAGVRLESFVRTDKTPKIRNSRYSTAPVAGTIPAALGVAAVSVAGIFVRTDKTPTIRN
jgi:hypothetical protein